MHLLVIILSFAISILTHAENLGQGRLFLGSTSASPDDLNTQLTSQNLKKVDLINKFGVEITLPTLGALQTGLRYTKHIVSQDENPASSATDYKVDLDQEVMLGIVRWPFLKKENIHMDVFGGLGASSATYKIKTASLDGALKQSAALNYVAGASLALGFKKFYLVLEGGYENNKLDDLKVSGNLNNSITEIDMSGTYFLVGLMFDGVPVFTK